MLVLSNEEIARLVTVADVMEVLESAYRDLGNDAALEVERIDSMMPLEGRKDRAYAFKQMGGGLPGRVQALRINSDIVSWPAEGGSRRKVKVPAAGGRWVGLVYLFDATTGMPLAIMPDGVLQHIRVAATSGLAARLLAPQGAPVVALLGTGWQAETQLEAAIVATGTREVRIFSPNPEHRGAFCQRMASRFPDVTLIESASADECVEGAEVIAAATNSMTPVLRTEWIRPGRYFSTVKTHEVDSEFIARTRPFLHNGRQTKETIVSVGPVPEFEQGGGWWQSPDVATWPDIVDLLCGKAKGRQALQDVTLFINNIGMGLQFAAAGEVALARAKEQGVGHELPDEWFTENVHP